MSYADIAEMAVDTDLRQRLYACVASLRKDNGAMWVDRWVWLLVAGDPSWSNAWAVATGAATPDHVTADVGADAAGDVSPVADHPARPGWVGDVITDDMILDRVQQVWEQKGEF